jgi:hypothetical protein
LGEAFNEVTAMRTHVALFLPGRAILVPACAKNATRPQAAAQGVRIVNAYTLPVDMFVDGALAATAVTPA